MEHFCKIQDCQNICSETAIKANFHFSHYKLMETKLPKWWKHMRNGNKKASFVEANVMNISAKFQLYPLYGFWYDIWIFFLKFSLLAAMATD